ncbi:stage II sporulation protein M [Bacillus sp. GMs2/2]|uniref:stage II sporulation protein M n=1 Tax=Bacillus sp. GMs2/2 TaxID=3418494 RepID=UPI003CEBAD19
MVFCKKNWKSIIVLSIYILGLSFGVLIGFANNSKMSINPQNLGAVTIIFHNLGVIGIMFLGILSFGVVTLITILFNGSMLGTVVGSFWGTSDFLNIILTLIPYGILEIPAFIIAAIGDLCIIYSMKKIIWNKDKKIAFYSLKKGLKLNVIGVIMVVIAGIIEAKIPFISI